MITIIYSIIIMIYKIMRESSAAISLSGKVKNFLRLKVAEKVVLTHCKKKISI
jgi:hypothetical protein